MDIQPVPIGRESESNLPQSSDKYYAEAAPQKQKAPPRSQERITPIKIQGQPGAVMDGPKPTPVPIVQPSPQGASVDSKVPPAIPQVPQPEGIRIQTVPVTPQGTGDNVDNDA